MSQAESALYTLDLAGAAIGLDCRQPDLAVGLTRWFGRESAPVEPHIRLDLEMVPHEDVPVLPNNLLAAKTLGPDGAFDIADGLMTGFYDATRAAGELRAKGILLTGGLMRIFEQVLYQAHASARRAAKSPGFLVHSAAVIADGHGFLFVGPPEAGKTTAARNSRHLHVLGDEMSLVVPGDGGLDVVGTPFNGLFKDKQPGRAPLTGVFLLEQDAVPALIPLGAGEAVAALAAEVVPPVGLDEVPDGDTVPAMLDLAASLLDRTEVLQLRLRPDSGFWSLVADHFGLDLPAAPDPGNGDDHA